MESTLSVCSICKKKFVRSGIIEHLKNSHNVPEDHLSGNCEQPFQCHRCNSNFRSWGGLNIHKDTVCGEMQQTWDPPAPITIYCRIKNVPYGVAKYNIARGFSSIKLQRIEDQLMNHEYSCKTCEYLKVHGGKKNRNYTCGKGKKSDITALKESICKSFKPR